MSIVPQNTPLLFEMMFQNRVIGFVDFGMQVDARTVPITPGMTATAEIKLDKKRIIDFFIPALDHVKESLKWR